MKKIKNEIAFFKIFSRFKENFSLEINYVIYQSIFVLLLTTIWACLFTAYYSSLDPFEPRFVNKNRTPGMSFRARSENIYSTLIHFKHGGSGNWQNLVSRFLDFIKFYGFGKRPGSFIGCNWESKIDRNTRCGVSPIKWAAHDTDTECTKPEKFGMYIGKPCMMIKLNKVYGWEPDPYYNITEIMELPKMPRQLKDHIQKIWTKNCKGKGEEKEAKCPQLRMVWTSCEGETAADEENLGGVSYTPWQGFPGFYYPYLNQMHYLSPIVFIQFRNLTPGVIVQIRCKAWARNIQHDELNPRIGGVHFEMMMD